MKINHDDLVGSFEQQQKLVSQFTLFQDIFFSHVMRDEAAAEYVLRLCTGISDLKIIRSNVQEALRNLYGKSSVLDFVAKDSNGALINIEVQNSDDNEYFGPKRARYYQSMIDSTFVPKGTPYSNLPEVYIIFITPFNPLKAQGHSDVMYEKRTLLKDVDWNNDVHEIYLNAEVKDNTELSAMLQYFLTADPNDTRFGALSNAVRKTKNEKEEVIKMCKAVEEYAVDREKIAKTIAKVEVVENLLKRGFPLSEALEIAEIDEETYNQYKAA